MGIFRVGDVPYPPRTADGEPIIDWPREVNGTIDCPRGWKSVAKLGSLTIEDTRVEIYAGFCSHPDRCGITACQYCDRSPAATRLFVAARIFFEETVEGQVIAKHWREKAS